LNCEGKKEKIQLITSKGVIEVELFGDSNPLTVSNFLRNIKNEIYINKNFYKILNYSNNKIIHNGINPQNILLNTKEKNNKKVNFLPLEIKLNNREEPIYNQQIIDPYNYDLLANRVEKGSLVMVKIDNYKSSATEYFFTFNRSPEFDGRYSVFGRVVKGYKILNSLNESDILEKIEILD